MKNCEESQISINLGVVMLTAIIRLDEILGYA